jgi:hypothetical protein
MPQAMGGAGMNPMAMMAKMMGGVMQVCLYD